MPVIGHIFQNIKKPNEARDVIADLIEKEFGPTPAGAENSPTHLLITATINQVLKTIRGVEFPQ